MKKANFSSIKNFNQLISNTCFLHYAVDEKAPDELFPFKLRITHYNNDNSKIVRCLKFEVLRELKASAEYLSKYPGNYCEVVI